MTATRFQVQQFILERIATAVETTAKNDSDSANYIAALAAAYASLDHCN